MLNWWTNTDGEGSGHDRNDGARADQGTGGGDRVAMVAVNYLANALPLNGRRTGDVSDAYPSLFTPAGLTFAIWGVIYLLLGCVLYQLGFFRGGERSADRDALLNRVGLLFSISSLANTAWVFAWHYDIIRCPRCCSW